MKVTNKKKNMRIAFFGRKFKCEFCGDTTPHGHRLSDLMAVPDQSEPKPSAISEAVSANE